MTLESCYVQLSVLNGLIEVSDRSGALQGTKIKVNGPQTRIFCSNFLLYRFVNGIRVKFIALHSFHFPFSDLFFSQLVYRALPHGW